MRERSWLSLLLRSASGVTPAAWLLAALAGGCSLLPGYQPAHFTVDPCYTDYVQILYFPGRPDKGEANPVRVDLEGSGRLAITTGRSPRVIDPFWKQSDDPAWGDLRTDQMVLSKEETRQYCQRLVDAGCYEMSLQSQAEKPISARHANILIAIARRKNVLITDKAEVLKIVEDLIGKF